LTTEECAEEITALKDKIRQLELDITLLKVTRIDDLPQPIILPPQQQGWIFPQPYWQSPIVTYCRT